MVDLEEFILASLAYVFALENKLDGSISLQLPVVYTDGNLEPKAMLIKAGSNLYVETV